MRNPHRLMSAVVLEPTCVLVGNLDDFHDVFKNDPSVIHEFAIKYLGRDVDLSHVINHPDGREAFRAFLKSEFNDENLMFWEDIRTVRHVQHFKDTPVQNLDETELAMEKFRQTKVQPHRQLQGRPRRRRLAKMPKMQKTLLMQHRHTNLWCNRDRTKLTRRATNPESIKWPQECSL